MRTIIMIAVAAVASAGQPQAATLGTIPVGPDKSVSGELDAPGPQKWTVNLQRGGRYAVTSFVSDPGNVSVHAAGGRSIVSTPMIGEDGWHGADFTAPYTGAYTVQVACTVNGCPGPYQLAVEPDCPGDASSTCRIAVGATLTGLSLFGVEDVDWRGASLAAGRGYHVTAVSGFASADALCLAVVDRTGREVAAEACANSPVLAFTPAASGAYFVRTRQGDGIAPGAYSLAVSQDR